MNCPFIPTYQIDGEVVDNPDSLWTVEEKRKFEIDFKTKFFIVMSLDDKNFYIFIIAKPPRKCEIILIWYMEFLQVTRGIEHTRQKR